MYITDSTELQVVPAKKSMSREQLGQIKSSMLFGGGGFFFVVFFFLCVVLTVVAAIYIGFVNACFLLLQNAISTIY